MSLTATLVLHQALDPSQTTSLRNAFARVMRVRFLKLTKILSEVVYEDNVFGLTTNRKPGPGAFSFPRSSDKVASFMKWLEKQVQDDILQVTQMEQVGSSVDAAWTNLYVQDSYKRGIKRARGQMAGVAPPLGVTGGIAGSLSSPFHIDRLGLLYTRVFSDLKGITNAMDSQITKVLTQGLAKGLNPRTIAKQLVQVITGAGGDLSITDTLGRYIPAMRRAEMLARTEIIRAYAEAQLQEFENWGIEGVSVKAEILTTKDQRTCSRCTRLEKQVFTINEARGVIPVHTGCRCIWVPFIEETKKKKGG
jgi:SPP1 gp7 family putative phage head morphogenesis protein